MIQALDSDVKQMVKANQESEARILAATMAEQKAKHRLSETATTMSEEMANATLAMTLSNKGKAFCEDDLSVAAQDKIAKARAKNKSTELCSKCRFSSGCLQCCEKKAIRYWMRIEAAPYLARRHGLPEPAGLHADDLEKLALVHLKATGSGHRVQLIKYLITSVNKQWFSFVFA